MAQHMCGKSIVWKQEQIVLLELLSLLITPMSLHL